MRKTKMNLKPVFKYYLINKLLPGPSINAWISVTSESLTAILIPSGGSFISSSCSFTILRIVWGERFSTLEI